MYTGRFALLYLLAGLALTYNGAIALTTWESIHQTLHMYPLAIDSKDFGLFSEVRNTRIYPKLAVPLNLILTIYYLPTLPHHSTQLQPNRT